MKAALGIFALFVVVAVIAGMGGANDESSGSGGPGSAAVYDRIASLTDCAELQAEFDQAAANNERENSEHDLFMMRVTTSYMEVANDRMDAVGCFG